MRPQRIVVNIDDISLDGFDARSSATIKGALERELTRLFASSEADYRSRRIERFAARPIRIASNAPPSAVGGELAERVFSAATSASPGRKGGA
jgi:hypothetical protein